MRNYLQNLSISDIFVFNGYLNTYKKIVLPNYKKIKNTITMFGRIHDKQFI